jgi:hypothetical protein
VSSRVGSADHRAARTCAPRHLVAQLVSRTRHKHGSGGVRPCKYRFLRHYLSATDLIGYANGYSLKKYR